jgi:hypothetical protein
MDAAEVWLAPNHLTWSVTMSETNGIKTIRWLVRKTLKALFILYAAVIVVAFSGYAIVLNALPR